MAGVVALTFMTVVFVVVFSGFVVIAVDIGTVTCVVIDVVFSLTIDVVHEKMVIGTNA